MFLMECIFHPLIVYLSSMRKYVSSLECTFLCFAVPTGHCGDEGQRILVATTCQSGTLEDIGYPVGIGQNPLHVLQDSILGSQALGLLNPFFPDTQ